MNALQILGLILLVIAYIIHKNTYSKESKYDYKSSTYYYNYEKLPSPLWIWILAFLISIIPFLNIIIFALASIVYYLLMFVEEDIGLKPENKAYKILNKIKTILTKDV